MYCTYMTFYLTKYKYKDKYSFCSITASLITQDKVVVVISPVHC